MSNRGDDRRKVERRNGTVRRSNNNKVNNEKRSGVERRDEDRRSGGERRHDKIFTFLIYSSLASFINSINACLSSIIWYIKYLF